MTDTKVTVAKFVSDYFGYDYDFLGAAAGGIIGFAMLFAFVFALSIKVLNFQQRWERYQEQKHYIRSLGCNLKR